MAALGTPTVGPAVVTPGFEHNLCRQEPARTVVNSARTAGAGNLTEIAPGKTRVEEIRQSQPAKAAIQRSHVLVKSPMRLGSSSGATFCGAKVNCQAGRAEIFFYHTNPKRQRGKRRAGPPSCPRSTTPLPRLRVGLVWRVTAARCDRVPGPCAGKSHHPRPPAMPACGHPVGWSPVAARSYRAG
jgi:hypothetical protein